MISVVCHLGCRSNTSGVDADAVVTYRNSRVVASHQLRADKIHNFLVFPTLVDSQVVGSPGSDHAVSPGSASGAQVPMDFRPRRFSSF